MQHNGNGNGPAKPETATDAATAEHAAKLAAEATEREAARRAKAAENRASTGQPLQPADKPQKPAKPAKRGGNKPAGKRGNRKATGANKPDAADKPERFTHATAITRERYSGPSGLIRSRTRDAAVCLDTVPGSFSHRDHCGLSDLRDAYGTKPFNAANADAGILARLHGLGYVKPVADSGGSRFTSKQNGKRYVRGGSFQITEAGAKLKLLPKSSRK